MRITNINLKKVGKLSNKNTRLAELIRQDQEAESLKLSKLNKMSIKESYALFAKKYPKKFNPTSKIVNETSAAAAAAAIDITNVAAATTTTTTAAAAVAAGVATIDNEAAAGAAGNVTAGDVTVVGGGAGNLSSVDTATRTIAVTEVDTDAGVGAGIAGADAISNVDQIDEVDEKIEGESIDPIIDPDLDLDQDSLNWLNKMISNNNDDADKVNVNVNVKEIVKPSIGESTPGVVVEELDFSPGIALFSIGKRGKGNVTDYKNLFLNFKNDNISKVEINLIVKDILKKLASPSEKGFVIPKDLMLENLPLINIISKYTLDKDGKQTICKNTDLFIENYAWIWNIINLNLYTLMLRKLEAESIDSKASITDNDDLSDYKHIMLRLYNNMDPSIRCKLNKTGISIFQNIYTGFDTEYKYKEKIFNDLISVQLAVNTRTILKIPKKESYQVCKLDTLTNKVNPLNKIKGFRYDLFETIVNNCINEIRLIKTARYDTIISILHQGFKNLASSNAALFQTFEKDGCLYIALPRTPVEKYVYLNEDKTGFSFANLLEISTRMVGKYLDSDYSKVRIMLKNIKKFFDKDAELLKLFALGKNIDGVTVSNESSPTSETLGLIDLSNMKRYSRSKLRSLDVNINRVRTNYVISHLTNADLSMLKDFDELKESLDIVNSSFITLGKPIKYSNYNVHIRDTMLLAPAGKKGLATLGDLLGLGKVELEKEDLEAMDVLLSNDRDKFLRYAITDAVITLLYANYMEDQLFKSRVLGIPISLSSLSATYVKDEWEKIGYKGYQINPLYLIGDSGVTQTPQGLYKTKEVGRKISMYISNYRGGRNESFMYGVDNDRIWYDYDLTSAYTTAMSLLGNPDYGKSRGLSSKELEKLTDDELIMNYIVFAAKFKFPKGTKYPSIPCYLNESTTIYPLEGGAILTGLEYLLAKEQKCKFSDIKDIFLIPFERTGEKCVESSDSDITSYPFRSIIKELQARRSQYPKKTLGNLMEKEKGNSIYGNVVRGMSNKKKFDIKTGRTLRMEGGILTNPIIASWITAFIRSVVGESIHNVALLGGKVVSVTTDGFITDLENLEYNLLSRRECSSALLNKYREAREFLSSDSKAEALELKSQGRGIISWTTRGQFSIDGEIKAATGFQSKGVRMEYLDKVFRNTMSGEDRIIEFIQSSLRSAKDIYVHGGHVTKTFTDRIFRMEFDNKRVLNVPVDLDDKKRDYSDILLDSSPAENIKLVEGLRFLSCVHRKNIYNKSTSVGGSSVYKSNLDLAIRNFIKGCIKDPPGYNLSEFDSYSDLIDFVKAYKADYRISKASISNLKSRKMIVKGVPKNPDTLAFVEYVKEKFPSFDENQFFEGSFNAPIEVKPVTVVPELTKPITKLSRRKSATTTTKIQSRKYSSSSSSASSTTNSIKMINDPVWLNRAMRNFVILVTKKLYADAGIRFDDYYTLIVFMTTFKRGFKISPSSIYNLRVRDAKLRTVILNDDVHNFYMYIKKRFPEFKLDWLGVYLDEDVQFPTYTPPSISTISKFTPNYLITKPVRSLHDNILNFTLYTLSCIILCLYITRYILLGEHTDEIEEIESGFYTEAETEIETEPEFFYNNVETIDVDAAVDIVDVLEKLEFEDTWETDSDFSEVFSNSISNSNRLKTDNRDWMETSETWDLDKIFKESNDKATQTEKRRDEEFVSFTNLVSDLDEKRTNDLRDMVRRMETLNEKMNALDKGKK